MTVQNLKQLESLIKKRVSAALLTDVARKTKETMKEKIDDEVYAVYPTPSLYERQKDDGGLTDDENIHVYLINETTLSVESHRMDGSRNVSEVVETGQGYEHEFPYYGKPRPFTEETREELINTGSHKRALYEGLKKQGVNVEIK